MAENKKEPCWYVVHTYSGYENKVKQNLLQRIEAMGLEDMIFKIEIPTETVTEIKEGGRTVGSGVVAKVIE